MAVAPAAILLDVMGTLVYEPFYTDVPAFFGMTLQELLAAKHPRAWVDFEHGEIDERTFLRTFFADERDYDHLGLRDAMVDAYAWLEGIEPLLVELHGAGVPLHLLSNYPCWYQLIEDKLALSRYATWSFVSCDMGVRKPDPEAYLKPARQLGLEPGQLLFVDDRAINCDAARAVGMDAILFEDAAQLRGALAARGLIRRVVEPSSSA